MPHRLMALRNPLVDNTRFFARQGITAAFIATFLQFGLLLVQSLIVLADQVGQIFGNVVRLASNASLFASFKQHSQFLRLTAWKP